MVSGSNLYAFPWPDSDYDSRGAHILLLGAVMGLEVRDETVERTMRAAPQPSPRDRVTKEERALKMGIVRRFQERGLVPNLLISAREFRGS